MCASLTISVPLYSTENREKIEICISNLLGYVPELEELKKDTDKAKDEIRTLVEKESNLKPDIKKLEQALAGKMRKTNLTYKKIERTLKIESLINRQKIKLDSLEDFLKEMSLLKLDLETVTKMMRELRT